MPVWNPLYPMTNSLARIRHAALRVGQGKARTIGHFRQFGRREMEHYLIVARRPEPRTWRSDRQSRRRPCATAGLQ